MLSTSLCLLVDQPRISGMSMAFQRMHSYVARTSVRRKCILLAFLIIICSFSLLLTVNVRRPYQYRPFALTSDYDWTHCKINSLNFWKRSSEAHHSSRPDNRRFMSHQFPENGIGIGNLMFIYAALWAISHKNNFTPVMRPNTKLHEAFSLEVFPYDQYNDNATDCDSQKYGSDQCCVYDNTSEHLSASPSVKNITLWGHFQSFKFFHPDYESDIRRQFRFKDNVISRALSVLQRVTNQTAISFGQRKRPVVGIHVRRGDITLPAYTDFGFTVPTKEYYQNAIGYLKERGVVDPVYVVCSNDLPWAQENLHFSDMVFVENEGDLVDLAVLTLCDYLILSIGTYSFFAGYLSNASVVIYFGAYPLPGSDLDRAFHREDYWMPEWITLQ